MDLVVSIIGGLVVAAVSGICGYLVRSRLVPFSQLPGEFQRRTISLTGKPLSASPYYPVKTSENGRLTIDKQMFLNAVTSLLAEEHSDKAASDLIYLGDANLAILSLSEPEMATYNKLKNKYRSIVRQRASHSNERSALFARFREIVHGIGDTFHGLPVELVLHDTRDPLHSIVTVRNAITGRKIDDPTTDFGVDLIRSYARHGCIGNQVSYRLITPDGRHFKSTTIPIDDDVFGLIGFICLNMDIDQLSPESKADMKGILERLIATPMGPGSELLLAEDKRNKADGP